MLVAVGYGLLLVLGCKEEAWLQLELLTFQQDALVREGHGGAALAFAFDGRHAFESCFRSRFCISYDMTKEANTRAKD